MTASDNQEYERSDRFSIDSKLIGILSVFAFTGILLVVITVVAAATLTGLQSYSILQTHWNEIRKDATGNLITYIHTGNDQYLVGYQKNRSILKDLEKARIEILSEDTDAGRVGALLATVGFEDKEVRDMIKVAKRFGGLQKFSSALNYWEMADGHLDQLNLMASDIAGQPPSGPTDPESDSWVERIESTDEQVTGLQYDLAGVLIQGSRRLENIIFWLAVGAGLILFLVGGVLSWRFLRSIHQWEHELKMNHRQVKEQLEERTVLLEEIHHRVKNNLAFVSSLLFFNEEEVEDLRARQQLKEAQHQIKSIAETHEIFYDTEDFAGLSVKKYTGQIFERVFHTFEPGRKPIAYSVVGDDTTLAITKAINFGLILNELATNTYKHAFPDTEQGEVSLEVQAENGIFRFIYRDSGKGLPGTFDFEQQAQKSLGMRLIHTFLDQLEANYRLNPEADGFCLEFAFRV